MIRSHLTTKMQFLIAIIVIIAGVVTPVVAQQRVYWRDTDPNGQSPHDDPYDAMNNPTGWQDTNGGNTGSTTIPAGMSIYFGVMNIEVDEKKVLNLKLNWLSGNPAKFAKPTATGYSGGMPVAGYISSGRNKTNIFASWDPCPAWEYITLKNFSSMPQTVQISPSVSPTKCLLPETSASGAEGDTHDTLNINDAFTGILGEMLSPTRLTMFEIYPEHQEINPGSMPMFIAPPHTGNWLGLFMFVDPTGAPRPGGGALFITDGPGIMNEDFYSLSFSMLGSADTRYTIFEWDDNLGEWNDYILDLRMLPWYEDFEIYDNGELLHGASDWRGWDDDPAFDAPVTDVIFQSEPFSVDINGDADLVRIFDGADNGAWTFEAWQYIPSDFTSGGGGQFDGTYFNLLNTYTDGTPHNPDDWSVQIQSDSNDGLLKVFHGDDINTINVPYDTDRWVKIQVEIDLEDDWTQIYYDDKLVTEYSWTGGILGGGSGALDIAAVDLYAQGSSSVYYDDLVLIKNPPPPCPADLNMDGDLNFFDVSFFLSNMVDFNNDGDFNFFDVSAFLQAFAAGCP